MAGWFKGQVAAYFAEKGSLRLKGTVTLTFGLLSKDREGGVKGGAPKATAQK